MNMRTFVDLLSIAEMNELSYIIHDKRIEYARQNLKSLDLNERLVASHGYYIPAIKLYRDRNNSSLLEAKLAIDVFRDNNYHQTERVTPRSVFNEINEIKYGTRGEFERDNKS